MIEGVWEAARNQHKRAQTSRGSPPELKGSVSRPDDARSRLGTITALLWRSLRRSTESLQPAFLAGNLRGGRLSSAMVGSPCLWRRRRLRGFGRYW